MESLRALVVMILLMETGLGNIDIRRGGWLHRVVQYHKGKFVNEIRQMAPVQIKAKIIPIPPGYKDSKDWNFESVLHLMVLIRGSESAAPVYRTLRRMLMPTRRIMMSMKDSFKHFPSLTNESLNNIYYDFDMDNYEDEPSAINNSGLGDDALVVITNPVESRLPSALITVKLLKEILVQRAKAARSMPTTARSTIPWIPMEHSKTEDSSHNKTEQGDNEEGDKKENDKKEDDNKGDEKEKPAGTGGTTIAAVGTITGGGESSPAPAES